MIDRKRIKDFLNAQHIPCSAEELISLQANVFDLHPEQAKNVIKNWCLEQVKIYGQEEISRKWAYQSKDKEAIAYYIQQETLQKEELQKIKMDEKELHGQQVREFNRAVEHFNNKWHLFKCKKIQPEEMPEKPIFSKYVNSSLTRSNEKPCFESPIKTLNDACLFEELQECRLFGDK